MFGPPDIVDIPSRIRVLNLHVFKRLEKVIDRMIKNEYKYAYVIYDFSTNKLSKFKFVNKEHSLIRRYRKYVDDLGRELYYSSVNSFRQITDDDVFIAGFHIAPRGNFNPSLYLFQKSLRTTYKNTIMEIDIDEPYRINMWFNEDVLMSNFDIMMKALQSEHNISLHKLLSTVKKREILVLSINEQDEECLSKILSKKDYKLRLKKLVLHPKVYKHIKKNYKKNIFIFELTNYLKTYFLLFEYTIGCLSDNINNVLSYNLVPDISGLST